MNADTRSNYERERRFIVSDPSIVGSWPWVRITQAYLWSAGGYAARVRLIERVDEDGELVDVDATYAIKGPRVGDERFEVEDHLPDFDVARDIIRLCGQVVVKRRYQVIDREAWDVDVFEGENEGLIIAELEGTEGRDVRRPEWCDSEITVRDEFNNESLALNPWRRWAR